MKQATAKKKNGCRVELTATCVWRNRSFSVITETSAVSFISDSHRLESPGRARRTSCGTMTSRMIGHQRRPSARPASYWPLEMSRKADRNISPA